MELLQKIDTLWKQEQPDMNKRNKLQQQRMVQLPSPSDPLHKYEEAQLTDKLIQQVLLLADELGLTEEEALALLHQAKKDHVPARDLYWRERGAPLAALLHMYQSRMAISPEEQAASTTTESTSSANGRLVQATSMLLQQGLVGQLINLIRNYTQRLETLLDQRRRYKAETSSSSYMTDDAARARTLRGLTRHIDFGIQQRQTAAEVLFFVSYQFHCDTQNELIPLIELIHGLADGTPTNPEPGLQPLDPRNVPSAYKTLPTDGNSMSWMGGYGNPPPTQQEEKNPFEWEQELVDHTWERGHPQLLRCVSTLLMTIVSIMDPGQESLVSRETNRVTETSEDVLADMTSKVFAPLFEKEWKTPHILGVLLASYALALDATRDPAISSPLSPRNGPTSPFQGSGSSASSSSSSSPDVRRAFRASLERPAEFKTFTFVRYSLIPALQIPSEPSSICDSSEFLLSVVTGWSSDYFGLLLSRNPPISRIKWEQDAEEDLRLRRSDQEKYRQFQSSFGTRTSLESIPTSVNVMERPDCIDDLLALCFDVCQLGNDFASTFWDKQDNPIDVAAFIENMYWNDESLLACFYDLLSSLAMTTPDLVHKLLSGQTTDGSIQLKTQWLNVADIIRYYARQLSETKGSGSSRNSSTSSSMPSEQSTMYYYYDTDNNDVNQNNSTKRSSASSGVRELAEANALILGSHLRLIEVVASRSPEAREYLRKMELPGQQSSIDRDSFKEVLFTLSALPMSPELRGLVFEAIASITAGSSMSEVRDAWNYVEDLGILPIHKLLVYPMPVNEATAPCIMFPPSSTARINEKHCKSWIPANPRYSLLYEMEYIEASRGVYPATAGFLRLLKELILSGGCPADLGSAWRSRLGCSPYIEYVIHLVLPRFVGTFGRIPALPCRSDGDKNRILSMGLDVISACLKRYVVPIFARDQEPSLDRSLQDMQRMALQDLSLPSLVNDLIAPVSDQEFRMFLLDFLGSVPIQGKAESEMLANQLKLNTNVPKAKSPGFLVLSELVNRTGSATLSVVRKLLSEGGGQKIHYVDRFVAAHAVYGATPPTIASAKAGMNYAMKNFLLPLRTLDSIDIRTASEVWKNRTTSLLEIICGAASREGILSAALDVYKNESTITPVVKFQSAISAPSTTQIQVAQVGQMLHDQTEIRPMVELIGRDSGSVSITRASCGFLFYLDRTKQRVTISEEVLVRAMSRLVLQAGQECVGEGHELLSVVLARSIPCLAARQSSPLLGIPGRNEGLESIVHILNSGLIHSASDLASSCYECCHHAMQFPICAEYLRSKNFWLSNLNNLLDLIPQGANIALTPFWRCVAWVLAGLALELQNLQIRGFVPLPLDATSHGPDRYAAIKSTLLSQKKLSLIIENMELSEAALSDELTKALLVTIGALLRTSKAFKDRFDISEALDDLIARLATTNIDSASVNMAIAAADIMDYQHASLQSYSISEYFNLLVPPISMGGASAGVLASALAHAVLQLDCEVEDVPSHGEFYSAVSLLLHHSCVVSHPQQIPAVPSSDAIVARRSLKVLLPLMYENDLRRVLTDQGSFGRMSTPLSAWMDLVSRADVGITPLLQMLTIYKFGADLLLDADILRSLDKAAQEFSRHIQSMESQSLDTGRIVAPHYFADHLDLMSSIMVTASHSRKMEAANHVLGVLVRYKAVNERVLASFPTNGDATAAFLRCTATAIELAKPNQFSGPSSNPTIVPAHKAICLLALHIAESPLPLDSLRSSIPKSLSKGGSIQSSMASVDTSESKSWWSSLDYQNDESALRLFAIQGALIARMSLSLMREGSQELVGKLDCLSIARGLSRQVDAFNVGRQSVFGILRRFGSFLNVFLFDFADYPSHPLEFDTGVRGDGGATNAQKTLWGNCSGSLASFH